MVTSNTFPYVPIRMAIRDWETQCLALLDTGFTGDLVIPETSLPPDIGDPNQVRIYRVADGRLTSTPTFIGELEVIGLPPVRDVTVSALGSKYIIGLGIIERYVVTLDRGERVVVEQ